MLRKVCLLVAPVALIASLGMLVSAQSPRRIPVGDWPEARGPNRDGISAETGLLEKWALNGQNFLWRAPYGGRSAPIVMGNRVYVQNPSGRGDATCRSASWRSTPTPARWSGNTSSTSSRATCRRTASAGRRRPPIPRPATSTR